MSAVQSMKRGAIVLLDALGTKARWNKDQENFLFNEWEQILQFMEKNADTAKEVGMLMKIRSFSDTVLMSFSPDPEIPLKTQDWGDHVLLKFASSAASYLLALGLCLNIPFRGCIAYGDYYENDRALTGKIMFEAAEYYEQSQWIGVSLAPSANIIASRNASLSADNEDYNENVYITPYDVPLKGLTEKNGYGINFIKSYEGIMNTHRSMGEITDENNIWHKVDSSKNVNQILQAQLNENPGIEPTLKIRNTLAFVEHIQNNN
ncbi:hypothetical protein NKOR_00650 [Candidatus Nitrosopumilus koreensis AR1]|uniref:Uncharacterized protein n=1 Tax=Candidatus Nitrosopumilus koreensis AR1 TaxID=1229908 RepID=K0B210_9ARCH|nr:MULTISPECIES: hypothetical protein [Nitrosopumilus]AFS80048.1 hypothetical protein NKOR_00650 [Candidatus Nitrosopumilus koreensis AR1]